MLTEKERNSRTAREYAKQCGMKSMAEVETAALLGDYEYEPESWEYQYEVQHYTPDFKVGNVYVEVKGKATKETRNKLLAVKRCNPDRIIILRFLKGKNKISKGSKTTYIEWFTKHGFVCFDWNQEKEFLDFIKKSNGVKGIRKGIK